MTRHAALTHGFDVAFAVGATFCLAGAVLAATVLRRPRPPEVAVAEEPERVLAGQAEAVAA
jgi:hypothetical protein